MTSAPHIQQALERRFGGRSWMSSTEIEVAYDVGRRRLIRRFDFVAANVCAGHGFTVVGVEIKISRSDFLAEHRDPTKFGTLRKMTHVAYYAVPAGLLKKDELPDGAGLLELRSDGRLREMVKPVRNPEADLSMTLAGMLRRSYAPSLQNSLAAVRDELGVVKSVSGYQDADWWARAVRRKLSKITEQAAKRSDGEE